MGASQYFMGCHRSTVIDDVVLDVHLVNQWGEFKYNVHRVFPLPAAPFVWLADQLMWWRAKYHFHQVEPLRDISKISPRPFFLIQGGKDSIVHPTHGNFLFKAPPDPHDPCFLPILYH